MTQTQALLSCGSQAVQRLAPYEAKISGNFEIPMHVGKLIACWDRPQFVTAANATHMRDDDYVVGLEYGGQARAYPLWVTDNYHMINDNIAGDPILFATCERCQSGSAFIARVDGQPAKFSAMGMYNASLTMVNRKRSKQEKHSLWLHYEGVAIDGPQQGQFLEQIPTFHTTWRDWADLHPETDVMLAPDDPHHRDARHGHGREEFFCRPGMDPPLASTITGSFDHRYPENELVLGLNIDAGLRAYPLLEVHREGGVVNDLLGDLPIAVFAGPRPEQVTLSAFSRVLDDRPLTFEREEEHFRDRETGSLWTIAGQAVSGELTGQSLVPLRWQIVRWHAWVYPHPSTELFISSRDREGYPRFPNTPQVQAVKPILEALAKQVSELRFSHTLWDLTLPHEASGGICIYADQDRLNLYAFTSSQTAQDYVDLQGAWFCFPFDIKHARKRALRIGSFVLESSPIEQYAEPTQTVRYPDNQTAWSQLIQNDGGLPVWAKTLDHDQSIEGHFMSLVRQLKEKRYDIVEASFLPHSQQRVGSLSSFAATIEGHRFAIYKCIDKASAAKVAAEVTHALHADRWVFRSIPVLMYADPHYEMGQLPDDKITWPPLLKNERFVTDLEKIICSFLAIQQ